MQNAQLYALTTGIIAGVALTSLITLTWQSAVFLCLTFVSTAFVTYFYSKKNKKILILFFVFLGLSAGVGRAELWLWSHHSGNMDHLLNKNVSLIGQIVDEPSVSDNSTKILIRSEDNLIQVTVDRYSDFAYGDLLKVTGKIAKPKPVEGFQYDQYLARKGIFYTMSFPKLSVQKNNAGNFARTILIKIKKDFLQKIDQLFSAPQSGLLQGLLISGRSSLSKVEQEMFTRAGLVHIVALSGFNVTIIAQGLMVILFFISKRNRLTFGAVGIICFVVMTGSSATVVRAGIMALLVILAALSYKTYDVGRALFIAVLVMVLWNPMVIYDISFQLSCVATFAVIFAVPDVLNKFKIKFLPKSIKEIVLSTLVIEIFLLPILLSTAGQISLATVITNFLILPVLPTAMGLGFFATLLGYVHFVIALPVVALTNIVLKYIYLVAEVFSKIPFGVVEFSFSKYFEFGVYMFLGVMFWYMKKKAPALSDSAGAPLLGVFTSSNLERLDNFFQSHSNLDSQKKH